MISLSFSTPEDKWLLTLACGVKSLAWQQTNSTNGPSLTHGNITVAGPAACILFLDTLIPSPSLFPNGNVGMPLALLHWARVMAAVESKDETRLLANAELVSRQMHDGRDFLQGDKPGLADIVSASWLLPHQDIVAQDSLLTPWLNRMQTLAAECTESAPTDTLATAVEAMKAMTALQVQENVERTMVTSLLDV